jgi:hypothetical protein
VNSITVKVNSEALQELLERYSDWLDNQGLIVSIEDSDDARGHEELVADFFEETE